MMHPIPQRFPPPGEPIDESRAMLAIMRRRHLRTLGFQERAAENVTFHPIEWWSPEPFTIALRFQSVPSIVSRQLMRPEEKKTTTASLEVDHGWKSGLGYLGPADTPKQRGRSSWGSTGASRLTPHTSRHSDTWCIPPQKRAGGSVESPASRPHSAHRPA
jgi:hypothetical protein